MRVVDVDGELEQDVLVGKLGLLKTVGGEFALLVGGHEDAGELEGAEAQRTLRRSADVVDKRDNAVVLTLVVILVLDEAEVDEIAHRGTGVPTDVVSVDVNFFEMPDHLALIVDVGLGTRSSRSQTRSIVLVCIGPGDVDGRERESVGDFNNAVDVHAHEGAGRSGRESGGAVLGDFHHYLCARREESVS